MESPDLVRLDNWALLDLIAAAYSVRANQVFGPAWLSDQSFVIEAKVGRNGVNAVQSSKMEMQGLTLLP